MGLKSDVDKALGNIGSTKRYAEGQIPSTTLAEAAELTTERGHSVYVFDTAAVTPQERSTVKEAILGYFAKIAEPEAVAA